MGQYGIRTERGSSGLGPERDNMGPQSATIWTTPGKRQYGAPQTRYMAAICHIWQVAPRGQTATSTKGTNWGYWGYWGYWSQLATRGNSGVEKAIGSRRVRLHRPRAPATYWQSRTFRLSGYSEQLEHSSHFGQFDQSGQFGKFA